MESSREAMHELVAVHREPVTRYCRRLLDNHADTDDVSQTVFEQAFLRLEAVERAGVALIDGAASPHRSLARQKARSARGARRDRCK